MACRMAGIKRVTDRIKHDGNGRLSVTMGLASCLARRRFAEMWRAADGWPIALVGEADLAYRYVLLAIGIGAMLRQLNNGPSTRLPGWLAYAAGRCLIFHER